MRAFSRAILFGLFCALPAGAWAEDAAAPPAAQAEVLAVVHHVTRAAGGQGAGRELCDLLLVASGHYARLLEEAAA